MRSKPVLFDPALLIAVALLFLSPPLHAQKGGSGGGSGGSGGSKGSGSAPSPSAPINYNSPNSTVYPSPNDSEFGRPTPDLPKQRMLKNEQPPCFHWPMSPVASGVISVGQLDVPALARGKFGEACEAVREKKLSAAQHALNRALKSSPKFAPAWVLLGQVQRDQGKTEQAEASCTQARDADATYLASYLCLADLAARQEKWADVAELTNRVLASHPIRAPGAYYYNSLACFYLKQETQAEQSALHVLEDEDPEQKPQVHWLLAKIYEERGDRASEAAQLREYLKLAPHAPDAAIARQVLEEIKRQATDAASTARSPAENK